MTGQISDFVILREKIYTLGAFIGKGLFQMDGDLKPCHASTACWHGYHTTYLIEHNRLLLETVETCFPEPTPKIRGYSGTRTGQHGLCGDLFYQIHEPLDFTGHLLLCTDFIDELYEHGGFQQPWKYRTVLQLDLIYGTVIEEENCSVTLEKVRRSMIKRKRQQPLALDEQNAFEWYQNFSTF